MNDAYMNILIVEDNAADAAAVSAPLVTALAASVTVVDTLDEARERLASGVHDVVLIQEYLSDGDGLSLLNSEDHSIGTPAILLTKQASPDRLLLALRRGAVDVLTQPLDVDRLHHVIRRVVRDTRARRRESQRAHRLRRLTSNLIRDRRELRRRVDLICRDFVVAYRRLAEKVVSADAQDYAEK